MLKAELLIGEMIVYVKQTNISSFALPVSSELKLLLRWSHPALPTVGLPIGQAVTFVFFIYFMFWFGKTEAGRKGRRKGKERKRRDKEEGGKGCLDSILYQKWGAGTLCGNCLGRCPSPGGCDTILAGSVSDTGTADTTQAGEARPELAWCLHHIADVGSREQGCVTGSPELREQLVTHPQYSQFRLQPHSPEAPRESNEV